MWSWGERLSPAASIWDTITFRSVSTTVKTFLTSEGGIITDSSNADILFWNKESSCLPLSSLLPLTGAGTGIEDNGCSGTLRRRDSHSTPRRSLQFLSCANLPSIVTWGFPDTRSRDKTCCALTLPKKKILIDLTEQFSSLSLSQPYGTLK